jgi:hypothetical protein
VKPAYAGVGPVVDSVSERAHAGAVCARFVHPAQRLQNCAGMTSLTCSQCYVCGSADVKTTVRKSVVVCRCQECKTVWHVLPETEPSAA